MNSDSDSDSSEPEDVTSSILTWWKRNAVTRLSRFARSIFAFPATSVQAECTLSTLSRVISEYRSRLNADTDMVAG